MAADQDEDVQQYQVVVNDEEQYSIWFAERSPPAGWKDVGITGTRSQCLDYVEKVWKDMRPRSLREQAVPR